MIEIITCPWPKYYITEKMTNLQFRKKTDSIGLCRDEKLHEKSYFSRLERISISFDTDYHLNLHITNFNRKLNKQRTKISKLR